MNGFLTTAMYDGIMVFILDTEFVYDDTDSFVIYEWCLCMDEHGDTEWISSAHLDICTV